MTVSSRAQLYRRNVTPETNKLNILFYKLSIPYLHRPANLSNIQHGQLMDGWPLVSDASEGMLRCQSQL